MGEYANHNGERVKIGTCESMYYLRADQAHAVEAVSGNVDPVADRLGIRFRFPFPDEDDIEPGCFEDFDRGVKIPGWSLPAEFAEGHGSVQFVAASAGYVLSIPCPEQFGQPGFEVTTPDGLRVHRNGFNGGPVVRQQKWLASGVLCTVVSCGACGGLWRLETLEHAEPVIVAYRSAADERERQRQRDEEHHGVPMSDSSIATYHAMADRIAAGYAMGA